MLNITNATPSPSNQHYYQNNISLGNESESARRRCKLSLPQQIGHMTIKLLYCTQDKHKELVEGVLNLILEAGFLHRGNISISMHKNHLSDKVLILSKADNSAYC